MAELKYKYAYDEVCNVVSIDDYSKEESKQHSFRCIGCGGVLLPRAIGSVYRRAHFYHKEIVDCNSETYLHKLGKSLIKHWFETSDTFMISYPVSKECNNKGCSFRSSDCHRDRQMESFNLKTYYDTCNEEVSINRFIADLLLTNSQNAAIPPILIEICVTHKCEDNKRASGLKIIELTIENEQDIFDLISKNIIEEPLYRPINERKVEFISFKRNLEIPMESEISRYVFNPSIKDIGYVTKIKCKDAAYKLLQGSVAELNFVNDGDSGILIPLLWMTRHKSLRRCTVCKFYYALGGYEDFPICRLSEKYGTPKCPKMVDAEKCKSFHPKDDSYCRILSNYYVEEVTNPPQKIQNEYRVIIAGSSSFDDYELFKEKCDYYLSSKKDTHIITILSGTSKNTEQFIHKYGREKSCIIEPYCVDWQYGWDAMYQLNKEKVAHADALIAFWDGKGGYTRALIDAAKDKGIKVAIIKC